MVPFAATRITSHVSDFELAASIGSCLPLPDQHPCIAVRESVTPTALGYADDKALGFHTWRSINRRPRRHCLNTLSLAEGALLHGYLLKSL